MKKDRPSHKWTSDETNLFCQILAGEQLYGNFIERVAKKAFSSEVFDSIIAEFKEDVQFKEKE